MNLSVTKNGEIAIVEIPGDHLDAGNVKEFKREITQVLNDNKKVIFDFGQLRFVDSSGLGAILSSLRTLNAAGGDLKLAALSKGVRALFELVRMHRIFDIFNTVDEAVKAF